MSSENVSLVSATLAQVDQPARERIRADAMDAMDAMARVSVFEADGEVRVPGLVRCIVGTKP